MNYRVYKDDQKLDIRAASVYPSPYLKMSRMEYVQFPFTEPVSLTIHSEIPVSSVVIRPLSLHMTAELQNGEIHIFITKEVKFSVEINGSYQNNLLVLAEKDRYTGAVEHWKQTLPQEQFLYFPPGIHDAGIVRITGDRPLIYLEEGAYVNGKFDLMHCSHAVICGYGILTMEKYPLEERSTYCRSINAEYCQDLTIRDITVTDSNDWSIRICGCEDVLIDNVKIIGCRGNSDGVDICGSRNVAVKNVFTRVWDDSLVVKALDTGDVENVIFQDCVLWNDFARPMEVGVELRADHVRNVRFENIDILHSPTGYPLMGIHHGDRAVVEDITFNNIRIEDTPGAQLFDIRITPSYWNRDKRMGKIRNIVFSNIHVEGEPGIKQLFSNSRIQGYDAEHDISGVTYKNIEILGKTAESTEALGLLCLDHVSGLKIENDKQMPANAKNTLEMIPTEIRMSQPLQRQTDGWYTGTVNLRLCNPFNAAKTKNVRLEISPAHVGEYDGIEKQVNIPPNGELNLIYPIRVPAGKYVIAVQSCDPEIMYSWIFISADWVLGEKKDAGIPLCNYFRERPGKIQAQIEKGRLKISSELLKRLDCTMVLYTAVPVPRQEGEVVFSAEETDFGVVPAVIYREGKYELAPQLRCPLEITLVFKNEPKVEKIHKTIIHGGNGEDIFVPLEAAGLDRDTRKFWMEIEVQLPELKKYRYPCTLFHSVTPETTAHMFGNCVLA